jgi:hypothetical protein
MQCCVQLSSSGIKLGPTPNLNHTETPSLVISMLANILLGVVFVSWKNVGLGKSAFLEAE